MEQILVVLFMLASIGMVAMILMQHGKGADAGAAFGSGASATVFGSQGSANFLSRTTAVLAAGWFVLALALAYFAMNRTEDAGLMDQLEQPVVETPATVSDLPEVEVPKAAPVTDKPEIDMPKAAPASDKPEIDMPKPAPAPETPEVQESVAADKVVETTESVVEKTEAAVDTAASETNAAVEKAEEMADKAVETVVEKAGEAVESATEAASDTDK